MEKVALKIREELRETDLIVTSPYVRAVQTAEILSKILLNIRTVESPELVPHSPPAAFLKWLNAHGRPYKKIIAVGHDPHLSCFLSHLLTNTNESFIELKKSGIACVEFESFAELSPKRATLKWLITPKIALS